jgi:hypothetical protein
VIDGDWDHLFRIATVPDDGIANAAAGFAEYVDQWWQATKHRRESG